MNRLVEKFKKLEHHYKVLIGVKVGVATGLTIVHFAPLPQEYAVIVSFFANIVWLFMF